MAPVLGSARWTVLKSQEAKRSQSSCRWPKREGTSKRMPSKLRVPSLRRWVRWTSVVKASLSCSVSGQGRPTFLWSGEALQGSLADLGVDLAVVFQLDPGQGGFVELGQSQIGHPFEHRQQPAFNLVPKGLLLAILIRANRQGWFHGGCSGGSSPWSVSAASMAEPLSVMRARGKARF